MAPPSRQDENCGGDYHNFTTAYVNEHFPEQQRGIENAVYSFRETLVWHAGSYGGYSRFRKRLAQLVNHTVEDYWEDRVPENTPFRLLINFSDCEGTLNTQTCQILYEQFVAFQDTAKIHMGGEYGKYCEWLKALELAKDDGFISFH